MTQTEIYNKLMESKRQDPVRYGLNNIGWKWDAVNSRYKKHGADEEFLRMLNGLKEYIREQREKYNISRAAFKQYKILHGYNFNYNVQ